MKASRKIAGIACFATLIFYSGCWFGPDNDRSKTVRDVPMDLKAEIQTASELVDWIKTSRNQTEMKRKESFGKLKGRMVAFRGKVREVGKTAFGDKPFVSLKVGNLDMFENVNIQFNVKESQVSTVAAWDKGETHILRGRIVGSGDLEDDACCDNAEVVSEEKYLEVAGKEVGDIKSKVRETLGENTADELESSLDDLKNKLKDL